MAAERDPTWPESHLAVALLWEPWSSLSPTRVSLCHGHRPKISGPTALNLETSPKGPLGDKAGRAWLLDLLPGSTKKEKGAVN